MKQWNPVLNIIIEIKNAYLKRFGYITYESVTGYLDKSETCVERWVRELNEIDSMYLNEKDAMRYAMYKDMFHCLEVNQFDSLILVRYGQCSNIYDGETENSGIDFWERYNGFYRECRSVVIDVKNETLILTPFAKFFNINELDETSIENIRKRIVSAECIEFSDKLDGSMQSARYVDDRIIMAGSQAIDPNKSWRLEDGYRIIYANPAYEEMLRKNNLYTFIFEYISMRDAHVVKYDKSQEGLYLIGIRNVNTGEECDYETVLRIANMYHIPTTKLFDKTLDQLMNELDSKSSDEAEGFVINIDGYRVKLKYNDYVYIHKALSKLPSVNLIIRSIADDTYDDMLAKLPVAYHDGVKKVAAIVVDYIKRTEATIDSYFTAAPKHDKKEFMKWCDINVPKEYRGYVRERYLGNKINVIKKGFGPCAKYKKLKDMGIDDYLSVFRN